MTEMVGMEHDFAHPKGWLGEFHSRIEDDKLYVIRADKALLISAELVRMFRGQDGGPWAKWEDPDVTVMGVPQSTFTITAENGTFVYRCADLPCGCCTAIRQDTE